MFWLRRAWLGLCGSTDASDLKAAGTSAPAKTPRDEAAWRLRGAVRVQAATRARLRVLGRASSCTAARFVSYRRSSVEHGIVDQWYLASQLWADATLLVVGSGPGQGSMPEEWDERDARCHLEKGLVFLDFLWDEEVGGFYPRCNLVGADVTRATRFVDDNALGGLALLAAAMASGGPSRERYLDAAVREAAFLIEGGVWDGTFGGGFWWNTDRGDTDEGKSAHTNALVALFFARLYRATGLGAHREWALRTLGWLDDTLYDPSRQLYRWSVHHADPSARAGAVLSDRVFNYDQGIAVEAQVLAAELDGDADRRSRARAVGRALHAALWGRERGGYNLEAGVEQVYASYAAWTSLGHLALYDWDGDARWLDMARANADALSATLLERDGGYACRHYRCVDRRAPGCETGKVPWVVDHGRDTAAQAWIQHLQAAIARRLTAADHGSTSTTGFPPTA